MCAKPTSQRHMLVRPQIKHMFFSRNKTKQFDKIKKTIYACYSVDIYNLHVVVHW